MVLCSKNKHSFLEIVICIAQTLIVSVLLSSCSSLNKIDHMQIYDNVKIYSSTKYKEIYGKGMKKDYFMCNSLTKEELSLLNAPFTSATKAEISSDIAYNKNSIVLKKNYRSVHEYLQKNLGQILTHLHHRKNEIILVVYHKNLAIVKFVGNSYCESYLIGIDGNRLKIKLVGYLYT